MKENGSWLKKGGKGSGVEPQMEFAMFLMTIPTATVLIIQASVPSDFSTGRTATLSNNIPKIEHTIPTQKKVRTRGNLKRTWKV